MTIKDVQLLGKKIIVGILIFLIPALVISGGLHLTNTLLKSNTTPETKQNQSNNFRSNYNASANR